MAPETGSFAIYFRYAFVEFGSADEVQAAIDEFQGHEIDGRALFLDKMGKDSTGGGRKGKGGRPDGAGGCHTIKGLIYLKVGLLGGTVTMSVLLFLPSSDISSLTLVLY